MAEKLVTSAENKYKALLEEYCRQLFSKSSMPSHDHLHHARVWGYAKDILRQLLATHMINDPLIAEKTIIASYFHDTGLTINTGPDHGKESREICNEFLRTQNITPRFSEEVLDAVERHDDKSYTSASDPGSLAAIIAVADDMDAFGHIGVLRYWEIYSMRGITMNEMPDKIVSNAVNRFKHLESTYHMFPELVRRQKERLDILTSFYQSLKKDCQADNQHE
jgi:hypothetical protein